MTAERVRAQQTAQPDTGARMVFVTVAAIGTHTITVQLPGGGTVAGIRVAGASYSIGGAATALIQEPAVGPIWPHA